MHLLGALARPPSVLLIWHLHDYVGTRPVMRVLLRSVVSRCSMMIAVSSSVATDARKALPHGPPVAMIHNTVDIKIFTPHGPALDLASLSGLSQPPIGTMRVGLVATFAHWKGQDVFLRAAASVAGNHRFYIIGGPIYATGGSQWSLHELRARASALGLADRMGFTGFVEDVPAAMRGLDVVVHASTEPEAFGLVILQAMACARPVIATAVGGARELVEPGENVLSVPAGDSAALALAIERLVAEPALRLRLAEAGRANAERRFSRARLAAEAVGLYEDLRARCH
jgi:glycosyltransferase involved in cell wall biosynthesis